MKLDRMPGQGPLDLLEGLSSAFLKEWCVNEGAYGLALTNNKGEDCIPKYVPQGKSQVFKCLLQQSGIDRKEKESVFPQITSSTPSLISFPETIV